MQGAEKEQKEKLLALISKNKKSIILPKEKKAKMIKKISDIIYSKTMEKWKVQLLEHFKSYIYLTKYYLETPNEPKLSQLILEMKE